MRREDQIRELARTLCDIADRPAGQDLDFWLAAEREVDRRRICILSAGACPFQQSKPLNGGRHCSICQSDRSNCRHRAVNYNG